MQRMLLNVISVFFLLGIAYAQPTSLGSATFSQKITYIGYSKESQKKAEEEAMAGIARQIASRVQSEISVSRSEKELNGQSERKKIAVTKNMVYSDVLLKGVQFNVKPKQGELFVVEAIFDLDKVTAPVRFKLNALQKEVSQKESLARRALQERRYRDALRYWQESKTAALPYKSYTKEIFEYLPPDASMILKEESVEIYEEILSELRTVRLESKENHFTLDSLPENLNQSIEILIEIKDSKGALKGFPIIAEHHSRRLSEGISNEKGQAVLKIPVRELVSMPYVIRVMPALSLNDRKMAGIQELELSYKIKMPPCHFHFVCSEKQTVCTAIEKKLSEHLGNFKKENSSSSTVVAKISLESNRSLKQLTSYRVTLSLRKENALCELTANGVGKTEVDAVQKAISKMRLETCPTIFEFCEE